jgi:hypothetical protein
LIDDRVTYQGASTGRKPVRASFILVFLGRGNFATFVFSIQMKITHGQTSK